MADRREPVNTGIVEVSKDGFVEGAPVTITTLHKTPQGRKCDANQGIVITAFNNGLSAVVDCICGTSLTVNYK